jgi:hypothetical protein
VIRLDEQNVKGRSHNLSLVENSGQSPVRV